jgi:hypothetical protein
MCGRRMFVGKFTVLLRRSCMMLCVLMLAHRVMVLSLMVMMGRGVMMSRGKVMCSCEGCFGACAILTFLRFL